MPDGYLIAVGVKADFSELKQESAAAAETVQEMASEIAESFGEANDAAQASGQTFTEMAEAYAEVEAQGLSVVQAMNEIADATAAQAAAAADASAASTAAASDTTQSMSAVALATGQLNAAYETMAAVTLQAANSQNRVSDILKQYRSGVLSAAVATQLLSTELRENAAATATLAAAKSEAISAQSALTEAEERAAAATAENAAATSESAAADAEEATAAAEDAAAVDALGAAHRGSVSEIAAASGAIREFEGALPIRAVERFMTTTLGLGPILKAAFPVIGAIALGEVVLQTAGKLHSIYTELLGIKTLTEDIEKGNAQDAQRGGQAGSRAIQIQHEVSMKSNPLGTLAVDMDDQVRTVQALENRIAAAQKSADQLREDAKWANPVFGQSAEKDKMDAGGMDAHAAALKAELAEQQAILAQMQGEFAGEKEKEAKAAEAAEEKKQRAVEATARKAEEQTKKYEESQDKLRKANAEAQVANDKLPGQFSTTPDDALDEGQKELKEDIAKTNEELKIQAQLTKEAMEAEVGQNQSKQTSVKSQAQTGQISPQVEAAELAALIQQKIGIQNAYYQALELLYSKDSVDWQKFESERLATMRKDSQDMQVVQDNLAKQTSGSLIKAFDQIGKQWMSLQDRMLKGQLSIGRGMQQMSSSMLLDMVHGYEKMIAQTIRMDLMKLASTNSTNALTVASNATAAAASTAVTRTNGIEEVFIHAKVAAAKSFDWASGWGGPVAGAIAGALAFAGVMAVGAFENGGIIPGSIGSAVPILGHAGEAVLPQPMTKMLMGLANGGGARGGSNHFGGNTFNGIADKKTFQKMLNTHERTVAKSMKKALRNGRS